MTFSRSLFQVYNSHSLRADCLMGEFKVGNHSLLYLAYIKMRTFLIGHPVPQGVCLGDILCVRGQHHDPGRGLPGSCLLLKQNTGQFPKHDVIKVPCWGPWPVFHVWMKQKEKCLTVARSPAPSSTHQWPQNST